VLRTVLEGFVTGISNNIKVIFFAAACLLEAFCPLFATERHSKLMPRARKRNSPYHGHAHEPRMGARALSGPRRPAGARYFQLTTTPSYRRCLRLADRKQKERAAAGELLCTYRRRGVDARP